MNAFRAQCARRVGPNLYSRSSGQALFDGVYTLWKKSIMPLMDNVNRLDLRMELYTATTPYTRIELIQVHLYMHFPPNLFAPNGRNPNLKFVRIILGEFRDNGA